MKRLGILLVAALLFATAALAQEPKAADEASSNLKFRNRVFELHNRDPRVIADAITLLGSGANGASLRYNQELRTITVRDFPENIATMEEAIRRLDKPAAAVPDIELKISVLVGSKSPMAAAAVPDELAPVVKQLQSTLRYSTYGLLAAVLQRAVPTDGSVDGSGVAEPSVIGLPATSRMPISYSYHLRHVNVNTTGERSAIDVGMFEFTLQYPASPDGIPQSVGFKTPVSIRENEKVVIGTTTMGDKALIVVMTANVAK
jgi:hypothetical protein